MCATASLGDRSRPAAGGLLHCTAVPAGYSRRRLVEKLDLKRGSKAHLRSAPAGYLDLLGPLPDGVEPPRSAPRSASLQ